MYIRNSIGDIGLPCGIPISTVLNSSTWPSKASLSVLFLRKEETHDIKLGGRLSFPNILRS
jgi:hypothetical protein